MVIKDLYDAMRRGVSDDTLLMGCNTMPHLSAGVFELSRTGDDTSGRIWERTRLMGPVSYTHLDVYKRQGRAWM